MPIFKFDRYIDGAKMAEGVTTGDEPDFEAAAKAAVRLASRGYLGQTPILVLRLNLSPANPILSGLAVRIGLHREQLAFQSKAAFEEYIRWLRRPDIGDQADELTEADFLCDLAEPGWPDSGKWMPIYVRCHDGGEMTPQERMSALHYYGTDDGDEVRAEFRLP